MRVVGSCFAAAIVLGLAGTPVLAQTSLRESHIEGNVPAERDFDQFMQRDLLAYFQAALPGTTSVEWILLRRAPTQSGVANPKFYAWVKASGKSSTAKQGAVRLAAVDRTHFDVTAFMSAEEVLANPGDVGTVFPALLVDTVKSKAAAAKRS
jgi:hypothetical protein